jgi:Flp pilus assembly protein TadG
MMARLWRRRGGGSDTGSALVELAVALPVLILIVFGTTDFARVFYTAMELTNAARAGAQFGATSVVRSGDTGGMQSAATAAINVTGVTAVASRSCFCASNNGGSFPGAACTATCGFGRHMVVSVTVTASKTFTTIAPIPGIPNSIALTRTATLPVAN